MHRVFVTGTAGFIGSNLVDRLFSAGVAFAGWDDSFTAQGKFLENTRRQAAFTLLPFDILDLPPLTHGMHSCDPVLHLGANADINEGWPHPRMDLKRNTMSGEKAGLGKLDVGPFPETAARNGNSVFPAPSA